MTGGRIGNGSVRRGDGERAEPASVRPDPPDETAADISVAERRDHADDAQGHRPVVITEGERAAGHTPLGGGEDHEWLVGSETFDEVVDAVVTAVDRLGKLRPDQVEDG